MALVARVSLVLGSILLAHAAYSAHEHTHLPGTPRSASSQPQLELSLPSGSSLSSLPLDITLETLVSVLLLCLAIVSMSEELKPISWRAWAGQIEKQRSEAKVDGAALGEGEGFAGLDKGNRNGFLDIRGERKDFAQWAKGEKKI